jgi:hypothetical protein
MERCSGLLVIRVSTRRRASSAEARSRLASSVRPLMRASASISDTAAWG